MKAKPLSLSVALALAFTSVGCKEESLEQPPVTASPTPEASPIPPEISNPLVPVEVKGTLSAVWANDGGDKVAREERRATAGAVLNRLWDGKKISLTAARNEVVSLNLVIEAGQSSTGQLSVSFDSLATDKGQRIATTGSDVFDWRERPIELFYVRYLQIKGLSHLSYDTSYDERHVPKRFRRPFTGAGYASGGWTDRPDHLKHYPEIAVPLETEGDFQVAAKQNQSVWADIYVPKEAAKGVYMGAVRIRENGELVATVPVHLNVRGFALPDVPSSKTMVYLGYGDVSRRYTGVQYPNPGTAQATKLLKVRDRHFMMAHRHKLSVIDANDGTNPWGKDAPQAEWLPRLDGSLYTAANGYAGPGEGVGNGVFSIGTYGIWNWKDGGEAAMRARTDAWESWFRANSPSTERFLYLVDESTDYAQTEQWASWVKNNPGVGKGLATFATLGLPEAVDHVPSLNIAASWLAVGDSSVWGSAYADWAGNPGKRFYAYNGKRPASGSFATEDDGVALRELPWAQYKMGVHRWFFWETTYYNNFQGGTGQTNVFSSAFTFGGNGASGHTGVTGWNHSNGDGVLFYPGTDTVFPAESYGLEGPLASLRMKHWRRGIQDVDYLALARSVNPSRVDEIVRRMVPKALWEYGVDDPADPSWKRTDISWSVNPDDWEAAREELAGIIEGE